VKDNRGPLRAWWDEKEEGSRVIVYGGALTLLGVLARIMGWWHS